MSSNNLIIEGLTRHQIMIQRLGSGEYKKLEPILKKMAQDIRYRLLDEPTDFQLFRLQALLDDVNDTLREGGAQLTNELFDDLVEFAEYEAEFTQRIVSPLVTADTVLPSTAQIVASLTNTPTQLVSGKKVVNMTIQQLVNQFTDGKRKEVDSLIRAGFIEGKTSQQIAREIQSLLGVKAPRQAATLVRTATNHAGSTARKEFYRANRDIIGHEEWLSTLDDRTTFVCMSLDGELLDIDQGPWPPRHFNCLTGDTLVSTCSSVSSIYKRAYKGTLINIRTKSGRSIKVTPNHPILTSAGWVNAGDINTTHKLACVSASKRVSKDYKYNVVAKFSDLFGSSDVLFNSTSITNRPATTKDFHGDVTNGEVSIKDVDGLRWRYILKTISKRIQNKRFIFRPGVNHAFFSSGRFKLFTKGLFSSCGSNIGVSRKLFSLAWSASIHSCLLLFAPISKLSSLRFNKRNNWGGATVKPDSLGNSFTTNPVIISFKDGSLLAISKLYRLYRRCVDATGTKNSINRLVSNAEDLPDSFNPHLINGAEFDNVIDFFSSEFDGHVYNLENKDNWYIANGIITHNCRSIRVPVIKPEFSIFGNDKGKRASKDGPVSAKITYSGFLKGQSKEFQNDVLGKSRAELFRSGEVTLSGFVDDMGRTLTLDQLRQREGLTI